MLSAQTLLVNIIDRSPLTADMLIHLNVACVGCSMNKFCTIDDLCRHYRLDLQEILSSIQEKVGLDKQSSLPNALILFESIPK